MKYNCNVCQRIIQGLKLNKVPNKVENELYQVDLSRYMNINNVNIVHILHNKINLEEDFSKKFDTLKDLYFKNNTKNINNDILLTSLFEKIYLRIILDKTNQLMDDNTPITIFRKSLIRDDYHVNLKVYSKTSLTEEVKTNISRNTYQIIDCNDEEVFEFTKAVSVYFHTDLPEISKMFLIRYLKGKIKYILDYTNKNESFHLRGKNCLFNHFKYLERTIDKEFNNYSKIRIQIHEILGRSGIGKSVSIDSIKYLLYSMLPFINFDDLVYVRANDYWWNNYCGQPIVLYDDIGHSKKSKIDFCHELIAVGSGTFKSPPMAFLKDMPFTSSLVFITGNFPIITTTNNSETACALSRRIVSNQYLPLDGLGEIINCKYFNYTNKGLLLNTIRSVGNNRNIFSLFSESINIIKDSLILEFNHNQFSFENDLIESEEDYLPDLPVCQPKLLNKVEKDLFESFENLSKISVEIKIGELRNFIDLDEKIIQDDQEAPQTSSVPKSHFVGEGIDINISDKKIILTKQFRYHNLIKKIKSFQNLGYIVIDNRASWGSNIKNTFLNVIG